MCCLTVMSWDRKSWIEVASSCANIWALAFVQLTMTWQPVYQCRMSTAVSKVSRSEVKKEKSSESMTEICFFSVLAKGLLSSFCFVDVADFPIGRSSHSLIKEQYHVTFKLKNWSKINISWINAGLFSVRCTAKNGWHCRKYPTLKPSLT